VQHGNLEPIRDESALFENPEVLLDLRSGRDQDDDGLGIGDHIGEELVTPGDLSDRERGDLFQLELDHGLELLWLALREVENTEENEVWAQESEVEAGLEKLAPGMGDG
jgi:hypothetical protein